jgi:hypothetical protein
VEIRAPAHRYSQRKALSGVKVEQHRLIEHDECPGGRDRDGKALDFDVAAAQRNLSIRGYVVQPGFPEYVLNNEPMAGGSADESEDAGVAGARTRHVGSRFVGNPPWVVNVSKQ